jgi:hypothetical protein
MDIVIPVARKDYQKLKNTISAILENSITSIKNIYVIAQNGEFLKYLKKLNKKVILIEEHLFPFTINDISNLLEFKNSSYNHSSWYYQQLLKFYIFSVIENISNMVLILDSDFVFCKKISFISNDGKAILSNGYPFKWLQGTTNYPKTVTHTHIEFAMRFVPGFDIINSFSGMHHHMVFQKEIIKELFFIVEQYHKTSFWKAFINNLEIHKWNAASEYVIYYHFALLRFPDKNLTRHLKTCDLICDETDNIIALNKFNELMINSPFQAIGCHSFLNLKERINTMDYIPNVLKKQMLKVDELSFMLELNNGSLKIEQIKMDSGHR